MKQFRVLLFLILGLSFVAGTAVAADPSKDTAKYPVGTVFNQKTGKPMTPAEVAAQEAAGKQFAAEQARRAAEAERQRQEAERLRQEEERRNRCMDYEYQGSNVRPVSGNNPSGYRCPPGYACHKNGIFFECRYRTELGQAEIIPSSSPACRYENCE